MKTRIDKRHCRLVLRRATARSASVVHGLRGTIVFVFVAAALAANMGRAADATELRCGWFENPTPANAWLTDRHGQWIVGTQGGHQAQGNWPEFKPNDWIRTGAGSYGYGCACMRVEANAKTREITRIVSAAPRPLAACRTDPAINRKEPENPLKK